MKNAQKILALVGGAQILAVMSGLPVDANGFFLTVEQMEALDNAVGANELVATELADIKGRVTSLETELNTATESLQSTTILLTAAKDRITELEAMDGPVSGTHKDADEFDADAKVDPLAFDFQQEIFKRAK